MTDFHVHTRYCHGAGEPEDFARVALDRKLPKLGLVGHAFTDFDGSYCMPQRAEDFRAAVARAKEAFAGKLELFCGVEMDAFSDEDPGLFDYAIGSVHYVEVGGKFYSVDHTEAIQREMIREVFGGDPYAFAESYYKTVGEVAERTSCDIIGHFDLLTKFNEDGNVLDETHPRYVEAWQTAAEKLLKTGKLFEINVSAIPRGCRTTPYPAIDIAAWLAERGAKFILSSDAHKPEDICFQFDKWREAYGRKVPITEFRP